MNGVSGNYKNENRTDNTLKEDNGLTVVGLVSHRDGVLRIRVSALTESMALVEGSGGPPFDFKGYNGCRVALRSFVFGPPLLCNSASFYLSYLHILYCDC